VHVAGFAERVRGSGDEEHGGRWAIWSERERRMDEHRELER
jgi:hypothetical protein